MDKILLYHKLCDDGTKVESLLKGVVIPTYNEFMIVSGGKPKNKEILIYILSEESDSDDYF